MSKSRIDIIGQNGNVGYEDDDIGLPEHVRKHHMDTYIYKNGDVLFECFATDEDVARETLEAAVKEAESLGFEFEKDTWEIAYVY